MQQLLPFPDSLGPGMGSFSTWVELGLATYQLPWDESLPTALGKVQPCSKDSGLGGAGAETARCRDGSHCWARTSFFLFHLPYSVMWQLSCLFGSLSSPASGQ